MTKGPFSLNDASFRIHSEYSTVLNPIIYDYLYKQGWRTREERERGRQKERQRDRETERQTERKTERQRNIETERQKRYIFTVGAFALVGVAVAVRVHDGHAVAGGRTSPWRN